MMEDSFEYIQPNININNEQILKLSPVKPSITRKIDENKTQKSSTLLFPENANINRRNSSSTNNSNKLWQKEMNLISFENYFHNKDLVSHQYIKKVFFFKIIILKIQKSS